MGCPKINHANNTGLKISWVNKCVRSKKTEKKARSGYMFGFQNQEKDDELFGEGNAYSFEYRVHNAKIGRFLSIDPLYEKFPWNSSYAFAENKVIRYIELEGAETFDPMNKQWEGLFDVWAVSDEWFRDPKTYTSGGHLLLDLIGAVPGYGEPADLANAVWYYMEGDNTTATICLVATIPIAGWISTGGKWTRKIALNTPLTKELSEQVTKQMDDLWKTMGGLCFVEGTLILTKDGYKPIEMIMTGDTIYSYNESSDSIGLFMVYNPVVKITNQLVKLKIGETEILTTKEHPFLTHRGWVQAINLNISDSLQTYKAVKVVLSSKSIIDTSNIKVYNFVVNIAHTYYVSKLNILVHNTGCGRGIFGHTTPWANMSQKEQRAFQHSYSRKAEELGLPNWSQSKAADLQALFNSKITQIRDAGEGAFFETRHLVEGVMTNVRRTEPIIDGKRYYYYETMDGKFVSAGIIQ